jgi:hypothetical protein
MYKSVIGNFKYISTSRTQLSETGLWLSIYGIVISVSCLKETPLPTYVSSGVGAFNMLNRVSRKPVQLIWLQIY